MLFPQTKIEVNRGILKGSALNDGNEASEFLEMFDDRVVGLGVDIWRFPGGLSCRFQCKFHPF